MPQTKSARTPRRASSRSGALVHTDANAASPSLRLSDPAAKATVKTLIRQAASSEKKARAFLQAGGFLTASGRLPRKYGG
jgi:hypothetical protein